MIHIVTILCMSVLFAGADDRFQPWHPQMPLAWEDFQGMPDAESGMEAVTHSTLDVNWACDQGTFTLDVLAKFDREKSWAKTALTDRLLEHEQLHFDITELYARKLRAHFAKIADPCAFTKEEMRAEILVVRTEWHDREKQYDAETEHSIDRTEQLRWERMIASELRALQAFALP